ncbi:hypothetical protein WH47_11677 [Habropoda laboriosa]|uniref:Uncharacterized protein n=1 Tax=Habropoda laboriosa TaxID=597456 RepID=A0A0L7QM20_9HYME|nr:hypothetical protein WH47_11677 [Habropoda laboriosa]
MGDMFASQGGPSKEVDPFPLAEITTLYPYTFYINKRTNTRSKREHRQTPHKLPLFKIKSFSFNIIKYVQPLSHHDFIPANNPHHKPTTIHKVFFF